MCGCRDGERKSAERQNGNMNNVAFYAVSSYSPYGYLRPKLNTQKLPVSNTKHDVLRSMFETGDFVLI